MMPSPRRHVLALASVLAITAFLVAGCAGSTIAAPTKAPAPSLDLSKPSGAGGLIQPTTQLPSPQLLTKTPRASSSPASISSGAIPESRRLTLEFPSQIRVGDADVVRLTLEVDTLAGLTPTVEVQGNQLTGQTVQIPNLYETHNVIAEAELDLAGLEIQPSEPVSEPLLPGESVTFRWSVHPSEAATYRGTVWLFLIFVDKATKEQTRKPLSAQSIEIRATTFLGLSGSVARVAGGLGSVLGGVLGFPFIDDISKWLWSRLRQRA